MKRYLTCFLVLLMLFVFSGCNQSKTDFVEPVTFYYCNDIASNDVSANAFYDIFVDEIREGAGYSDNPQALLALYLQGPTDGTLVSPFPDHLQILSLENNGTHTTLIVSNELATLTGLDLTIACACLSMTVMELSGCESVQISAESALLDENDVITMTKDTLFFADNSYTISDN